MTADPQCSVIVPAYAATGFLARTVTSVLRQTLTDWELIVVADDAVDYEDVLHDQGLADPRVKFVSTGCVGGGAGTARNVGADAARARVVVTLDCDDVLDECALERLVPLALAHGAAYGDVRMVRDTTGELMTSLDRRIPTGLVSLETILTSQIHTYASIAFDRSRVSARWLGGRIGWEDLWFYAACFDDLDAIYHLAQPLYEYRRREGSTTTERGAAEYFLQSATELRSGLESGAPLGLRSERVRETMVRYLQGREYLEALYLEQEAAGRYTDFLDFVADHRDRFYRLDSSSPSLT